MVRAKRLSGLNPLAYVGVEPNAPLQLTVQNRVPTTNDYSNWNIGSMWIHNTTENVYMLVKKVNQVATWILIGAGSSDLETITGDSGGAVGPDGTLTINLVSGFSPITVDGNPGTNTLTINSDGTVAIQYDEDSGSAIPSSGVLNIVGGTGISTSGAGSTVTIGSDGTLANQYDEDSGSAVPAAGVLNIVGGTGISTSGAGNTVTVTSTTAPGTSYFFADISASISNVTGDSTAYLILFDRVYSNFGSDYDNTTGLYTAPSDGLYSFNSTVSVNGLSAGMDRGYFRFRVSGTGPMVGEIGVVRNNALAVADGTNGQWRFNGATSIFLNSGDTVGVTVTVEGAAKTADVSQGLASPPAKTWFSGFKVV